MSVIRDGKSWDQPLNWDTLYWSWGRLHELCPGTNGECVGSMESYIWASSAEVNALIDSYADPASEFIQFEPYGMVGDFSPTYWYDYGPDDQNAWVYGRTRDDADGYTGLAGLSTDGTNYYTIGNVDTLSVPKDYELELAGAWFYRDLTPAVVDAPTFCLLLIGMAGLAILRRTH